MIKNDMTTRIGNMMVSLSKAESEVQNTPSRKGGAPKRPQTNDKLLQLSSDRWGNDLRDVVSQKQTIESLQDIVLANREAIKRLKQEKKELLKTNFVSPD